MEGGLVNYCAPVQYRWFISHLPKTRAFQRNPQNLMWSQRIVPLTHADISWYNSAYDKGVIIDGCGEFSNVPLLGIYGGINYNPALARRQFGYPLRGKSESVKLAGIYYLNAEGHLDMKVRIMRAWHHIHRKEKSWLGQKLGVSFEPYLKWVRARALELKMPYSRQELLPIVEEPTPYYMTEVEELQVALTNVQQERDAWKSRYQIVDLEN